MPLAPQKAGSGLFIQAEAGRMKEWGVGEGTWNKESGSRGATRRTVPLQR